MSNTVKINLVDRSGRKYLNATERRRFIDTACAAPVPAVQTFALTLVYTGCRISEALALRYCDVDIDNACLRFKTLKRRREVWREVPVPRVSWLEVREANKISGKPNKRKIR